MSAPLLQARGVRVAFGGAEALRGADLAVREGEIVALLGASGSGKSTLVRALHLLLEPDAGAVLLDGQSVPPPARREAMRRLSLVQQQPGLLRAGALENVAFPLRARGGPKAEARERARAALAEVGLAHKADAPAATLSGGEAQRVAVARALVTRPEALLVDEGTNQLDPASVLLVEGLLRRERDEGRAVVLVTHSVAQARRVADRVAFLEAGRVAEEGPAREVLSAPRTQGLRAFLDAA